MNMGGIEIDLLSLTKRNRKEVIARYAKSKINIGKEHDRWMSLKDSVQMK
jgi:hypothetical protein